nr:MAG TPA: hypothetical protein [Caudoviricetes sp.]
MVQAEQRRWHLRIESERAACQESVFHRKRWEIPCYK